MRADVEDEVRLSTQKRRRLHHGHDVGHFIQRRVFMHVGQYWHANFTFDLFEYAKSLFHAQTAVAPSRRAIGLVERALENEGNAERFRCFLQSRRRGHCQFFRFDDARSGDQKERATLAHFK